MNVYENCPVLENDRFLLRLVEKKDAEDLLKVYGDKRALPYFNSDNCHGDIFYYPTLERMQQAVDFWMEAYDNGWFVRLAIVDKGKNMAVGTIELFLRRAEDYFTDCGLLRLDVGYDYENSRDIGEILGVITEPAYELFGCKMIATKAPVYAVERIAALREAGYVLSENSLTGTSDGKNYDGYWVKEKWVS